jgi:TonB-dependent starch-binding outer membrane protein SusC
MRQKLLFLCLFFCLGLFSTVLAQERTVTGKVTDKSTGDGIPGVSVFVKGTTSGTITDVSGSYRINVPAGGTLVFQAVGLSKMEMVVGSESTLDIQMEQDLVGLNEVVVTGYGVQEKRSITGSITSIKGATIENIPLQTFDRAIQGRIAGVQVAAQSGQPGGALNVRVRGIGSIGAGTQPLYIVDGVQLSSAAVSTQGSSNALGSLNPNDIESIEVLKDAAAAAIYGAQGANGVVIITTKKGKTGRAKIDFTIQEGVVQPMNLYNVTNAQQLAQLKAEAYGNAWDENLNRATFPTRADAVARAAQLFGAADNAGLASYDWVKALFQDAKLSTYDLSAQGGDEKTRFYVAGSYTKQDGQAIESNWRRGSLKLNVSHQATEKLRFGANITLSVQETRGTIADGNFVNGPWTAAFVMQPFSQAQDERGNFLPYPVTAPNSHFFGYNILQGVRQELRKGSTVQTISSITASYQIIPSLSFNLLAGVDFAGNRDDNNRPSTIPAFAASGGQVFVNQRRTTNFNTNYTFNYAKKFGEVHNVSAIVGYEYKVEQFENATATGFGFANPAFRLLSQASTPNAVTGTFSENKRISYFGQAKYDYKEKYFADVTFRRDGSSRFGDKNRFGTFYGVSAGWRITAESFMSSVSFLNDLKLRASYGVLGNSAINDYEFATFYGSQALSTQYNGGGTLRQTQLGNDVLTWEEAATLNFGLDFSLFKGRIYGTVEWYRKINSDLLLNTPYVADAGVPPSSLRQNTGKMLNRGIEVELNSVNVDISGFKWTSSFNISFLKNEILELGAGRQRIGNQFFVGQPIFTIWGYEYAGVNPANGRAMIKDTLGNYSYYGTARDQKVIGQRVPTYFGGFNNNFSYKGLSLEIFFQFQGGNDEVLGDLFNLYNAGSSGNNQLLTSLNRWQKPGDITNVPRPIEGFANRGQNQHFSDQFLTQMISDASYIRLKQIRLSYEIPSKWLSKIKLQRVNVFAQAVNLATFTRFVGIDPEVVGQNAGGTGSTFGNFPNGRQWTLGLTVGF